MALLDVRDLHVTYRPQYPGSGVPAGRSRRPDPGELGSCDDEPTLRGVSLRLEAGRSLGLAGESGSGKTTLAHALLRLLPAGTRVTGQVLLDGEDVLGMTWGRLRAVRWAQAAVVVQGGLNALDPLRTVGAQIAHPLRRHEGLSRHDARVRVAHLLQQVGLGDQAGTAGMVSRLRRRPAHGFAGRYPHQLSGGQRQRVLLAMALACAPRLLIADEPTTSLDAVARAEILTLLTRLCREHGIGLLMISHDPSVLATCDRWALLAGGRLVEPPDPAVVRSPAVPGRLSDLRVELSAGDSSGRPTSAPAQGGTPAVPLLSARGVVVRLGRPGHPRGEVALGGVDLDVSDGEVLAVVGEIGAGKTTLGRALVGLVRPDAGQITYEGRPLCYRSRDLHQHRRWVQYVPQEAMAVLNPRHSVVRAVAEGLRIHGVPRSQADQRAHAALESVGLRPAARFAARLPAELSAGQCRRVVLAAALALQPRVLIADEPTTALDSSARAEILDLLRSLGEGAGMATVLITHDVDAAVQLADRLVVMRAGRIVETGPTRTVLSAPSHPWTAVLVQAALPRRDPAPGDRTG